MSANAQAAIPIVGVTGGIGSGKSTVAGFFTALGYALYVADERAHHVIQHKPEVVAAIRQLFGAEAYLPDGSYNRAWVAQVVFQSPEKLQQLNGIVHPAMRSDFEAWQNELLAQGYDKPFALKEAAILYESGTDAGCTAVIAVYAPKTLRLQRATARDKATSADIVRRMNNQWSDLRKRQRADFTIFNDGAHAISPQVAAAIQWFCMHFPPPNR